jgi:hypothetical protein
VSRLEAIGRLWWVAIPGRLGGLPRLSGALADGSYLLAVPPLAALAVPAAVAAGIWIDSANPAGADFYAQSVTAMAALAAIGSLGAGLGAWTWIGYVFADAALNGIEERPLDGLLISWLLLAVLVVFIPQVAGTLAQTFSFRSQLAAIAARVLATAGLVFLWTVALPPISRPAAQDNIAFVAPVQTDAQWIVLAAAVAARIHAAAEAIALRSVRVRDARAELRERALGARRLHLPAPVAILLQAGFVVLMLSGVISGSRQALLTGGAAVAVLALRQVLSRSGEWARAVRRVPIVIRGLAIGLVTYLLADRMISNGTGSEFEPILYSVGIGLALFALLLPPRRESRSAREGI